MAPTIPTIEPTRFRAGETVSWTKALADYSNLDGYSLVYSFGGPSDFTDVTAENESDGSFSITLTAAQTAALTAGPYKWAAYAVTGTGADLERYLVASGVIIVEASLLGGAAVTSHAARTLAVIEAALEGRLTSDIESYTILGRSVTKIPVKELLMLRAQYRAEVWREKNPGRAGPSRKVAFVPA